MRSNIWDVKFHVKRTHYQKHPSFCKFCKFWTRLVFWNLI